MGMDKVIKYLIWIVLGIIALTALYSTLKKIGII